MSAVMIRPVGSLKLYSNNIKPVALPQGWTEAFHFDVCFTLKSGHGSTISECLLSANSGHRGNYLR